MRKKNAVIVIEVANRELDNALLLKAELEKRGYIVSIMSKTEQLRFQETDILITPNCYIKANYDFYRYRFNCKSGRIVNLQYEQVLSPIEEDNELYSLDPVTKEITNICWGRHTVDRLRRKDVRPELLPVTGAIQLDTTRPQFDDYWKSRDEIAKEFNLPTDKKWILYISSFACFIGSKINEVQKETHTEDNVERFAVVTDLSQKATLSWFDRFLAERDDYVVIYRPHPVELSSPQVQEVVGKHPESFRCIQDYEVKQWLKVADIPCTWLSTAISESYFVGKNCLVFRPCEISADVDCVLYEGVRAAEDYESFRAQILGYNPGLEAFPIDRNLIEYYYDFSAEPAYRKIADVVDGPLPEAGDLETYEKDRIKYLLSNHLPLKLSVKKAYRGWYRLTGRKIRNRRFREKFFVEEWEKTVDNRINNSRGIQLKEQKFKEIIEREE
ncbi:MAG: hypothetical protein IJG40_09685 [Oscillospiraceae bacterium]|nr:hypothetical protein [Oscillospiraceae bacterium]